MAMAGLNPMQWLTSKDPFVREVMRSVAQRRADIAADEREDLAERIIAALGRSMKN